MKLFQARIFLTIFIGIMLIPLFSFADTCCYIVPVKVNLKEGKIKDGFLILYIDNIHGFDNKNGSVKKTIEFNSFSQSVVGGPEKPPSTPDRIWIGISYSFDKIDVSDRTVIINDKVIIYNVHFFFSDKGLPFTPKYWTNKEGGNLKYELQPIPLSEIKRIERTGEIDSSEPW